MKINKSVSIGSLKELSLLSLEEYWILSTLMKLAPQSRVYQLITLLIFAILSFDQSFHLYPNLFE